MFALQRQKVVIVEDTIKLVKTLKLRKEDLLKRRAHMKLTLLNRNKCQPSPEYSSCDERKIYPSSYEKSAGERQVTPSPILDQRKLIDLSTMPIDTMGHSPHYPIAAGATVENVTPSKLLQVHAQVSDDEIFVEMLFHKDPPNLYSRVVQTVETLNLEVIRGSMQRSLPCGIIECLITAKVECHSSPYADPSELYATSSDSVCNCLLICNCSLWKASHGVKTHYHLQRSWLQLCKQLSRIL